MAAASKDHRRRGMPLLRWQPNTELLAQTQNGAGALNGWLHVCAIEATKKIAISHFK
jgi:hypothetical protein